MSIFPGVGVDAAYFFVVLPGAYEQSHDTEYMPAEGSRYGEAPKCEACGGYLASREWLPPRRVELTLYGGEWGDFAFFGNGSFVVTERVSALFAAAGLRGVSFEEVEPIDLNGAAGPPPRYLRARVDRPATFYDPDSSIVVADDQAFSEERPYCSVCRLLPIDAIGGFAVDVESWEGHDAFLCRNLPGTVVVTRRLRDLVEREALTNVRFEPTAEFVWDPLSVLPK